MTDFEDLRCEPVYDDIHPIPFTDRHIEPLRAAGVFGLLKEELRG